MYDHDTVMLCFRDPFPRDRIEKRWKVIACERAFGVGWCTDTARAHSE